MTKRKKTGPLFGSGGALGFSELHLPNGELLVSSLSTWRRAIRDQRAAAGAADQNLGWLDHVYLVPAALARSWAVLHSLDLIYEKLGGKRKIRLRGTITLDGRQWTPTGVLNGGAENTRAEIDLEHLGLTELLPGDSFADTVAGRLYDLDERMHADVCRALGRNFYAVGPVYPKAGEEPLGLGYNARVFPVDELEMGQWFRLPIPALAAAA